MTLQFRSSATAFGQRVAARRYRRPMQDSLSRPQLVWLYAANVACALIAAVKYQLPITFAERDAAAAACPAAPQAAA